MGNFLIEKKMEKSGSYEVSGREERLSQRKKKQIDSNKAIVLMRLMEKGPAGSS